MSAIIGPHIIGSVSPYLLASLSARGIALSSVQANIFSLSERANQGLLRRWQPRVVTIIDPNASDVSILREVCPGVTIVGRIYVPDGEVSSRISFDPLTAAGWAHNLVVTHPAFGLIDYWQIANEVCQFWDMLPLLNAFEMERMRLARSSKHGCAVLGFSVGQPDLPVDNRMACWERVYPTLEYAQENGHVICLHQYGAPALWGPEERGGADWFIHRLEHQVLPRLPSRLSNVKFVVTEYGIDGGVLDSQGQGYRRFTTPDDYAQQLINIGQYIGRYKDSVLGYTIFTLGTNDPHWESFNIAGDVANKLADYYESAPSVEPVDLFSAELRRVFGDQYIDLRDKLPEHISDKYEQRNVDSIKNVILHHSATPQTTTWQQIARYHVESKGWPGIAYHLGIQPNGTIAYLGDLDTIRYHAADNNTNSIGICCLGNYEEVEPPEPMLTSLRKLFVTVQDFLSKPNLGFALHREVSNTVCPGGKLVAKFAEELPVEIDINWSDVVAKLKLLNTQVDALGDHLGI